MKYATEILKQILAIAKDAKIWLRVLVLIIAVFAGAILFSKTKVKKEDCTFCMSQLKEVNETIKLVLSPIQQATYDTIKPVTAKQRLDLLRKLSQRIDLILKQDSINKQKSKL